MTTFETVPLPAAAIVATLVVAGALFTLVGSIGLVRLKTFYDRTHPPTIGTTFGTLFIGGASMLMFSVLDARPVLHELILIVFMVVTTPITFMMLIRAAVLRDRNEKETDSEAP